MLFSYEVGYFNNTLLPIIDALLSYKNINLNRLDITEFAEGSPLEKWIKERELFDSNYVVGHTSDILRMLSLWRYSGTYFDLDVIVQDKIASVGTNFACQEKNGLINSAITNLHSGVGRSISESFFMKILNNFSKSSWGGNGPEIITSVAKHLCNTSNLQELANRKCQGFNILSSRKCYEIDWGESYKFFDERYTSEILRRVKDSFAVHFWNSMTGPKLPSLKLISADDSTFAKFIDGVVLTIRNFFAGTTKLSTKSEAAYIKLARKYCPKVLAASGEYF